MSIYRVLDTKCLIWILIWRYCHYTILQVNKTRLTTERPCQVLMELTGETSIWIWKVKFQSLAHYLPPHCRIGGEHKDVYKIRRSYLELHVLKTSKKRMLYSAMSQISTLSIRKKKMTCEIVSESAPESSYSNGFVNDFSPIFTESLKTEGII